MGMFMLWVSVWAEHDPAGGHDVLIHWWAVFKEANWFGMFASSTSSTGCIPNLRPELQSRCNTAAKDLIQCWEIFEVAEDAMRPQRAAVQ
jgi:hypothetical protein